MQHLKNITAGNPKTVEQYQLTKDFDVVWFFSEDGKNWYEEQKYFADDTLKIAYDKDNIIRYVEKDVTAIRPDGLHTKDPKPQKQKVKLKRKKKEKHLRALEHPKAKPVTQKKAPKVPEAREGEYMAGEADNVFALTTVYATKAQAMRAAQAKWDKLQRGVAEFSISLATGRADIYTETPVRVSGFKRVIDEQDWTITKVTHFLNNSGFTTSLELEVRLSDVEYETEDDE